MDTVVMTVFGRFICVVQPARVSYKVAPLDQNAFLADRNRHTYQDRVEVSLRLELPRFVQPPVRSIASARPLAAPPPKALVALRREFEIGVPILRCNNVLPAGVRVSAFRLGVVPPALSNIDPRLAGGPISPIGRSAVRIARPRGAVP